MWLEIWPSPRESRAFSCMGVMTRNWRSGVPTCVCCISSDCACWPARAALVANGSVGCIAMSFGRDGCRSTVFGSNAIPALCPPSPAPDGLIADECVLTDLTVTLILRGSPNVTLVWTRHTCAYQRFMAGGLECSAPRADLPQPANPGPCRLRAWYIEMMILLYFLCMFLP